MFKQRLKDYFSSKKIRRRLVVTATASRCRYDRVTIRQTVCIMSLTFKTNRWSM